MPKPKISVLIDDSQFQKDLNFLIEYTLGTIDGIERGKYIYLKEMGIKISEILGQYIDKMAQMEPETLHHVYEWEQVGMPNSRLFKIVPTYTKAGVTFSSIFTQSKTKQESRGSEIPFKNKAYVMENGMKLIIKPKQQDGQLRYYYDKIDEWVTSTRSVVKNPGGDYVPGSFGSNFRTFFAVYLNQSRLMQLGMMTNPLSEDFSKGLKRGIRRKGGRLAGIESGYKWIVGAAEITEVD